MTEIFNNDLAEFLRVNDIIEQVTSKDPDIKICHYDYKTRKRTTKILKSFKSIIIQPDLSEPLGDSLCANFNLIHRRIELGRKKAEKILSNQKKI